MSKLGGAVSSSSMISLQRSMHSSQMYTPGPAISFLTWRCDFPQKLQRSCSLPSLGRAISPPRRPELRRFLRACHVAVRDHAVDDAVVLRFLRAHEEVSFHVTGYVFYRLSGVERVDLLQAALEPDDLACLDLDVGALPLEPSGHLVDQDPGVRQGHALSFRPAREKQ